MTRKKDHRGKNPLQKMITSKSCIYGKAFRRLSFALKELGKIHFAGQSTQYHAPSGLLDPMLGCNIFSNLELSLYIQVPQALKASFHSNEVDVNVGRVSNQQHCNKLESWSCL